MIALSIGMAISGCSSSDALNSQALIRRQSSSSCGHDRGRSAVLLDECQLTEELAGAHVPNRLSILLDARVAVDDEVEHRGGIALSHHRLAGRVMGLSRRVQDLPASALVEGCQQGDRGQSLVVHRGTC